MFLGFEFFLVFAAFALFAMCYSWASGGAAAAMAVMRGIPGREMVDIQVGDKRVRCRVIEDKWWYDIADPVFAAGTYQFFRTLAAKSKAMADFEGDKSLVKEREYALVYGAVYYMWDPVALGLLTPGDALVMRRASYEWKQSDVTVSEDNMIALEGGSSYRISGAAALAAEAQPGDGRHDNMRFFRKPILVLGGRSIEFNVTLDVPTVAETYKLMIRLWGLHLLPVKIIHEPLEQAVRQAVERQARPAKRIPRTITVRR